ncbi:DeoR/GlpR family DNA-binding transcription regulator [Compostimonas suwonensis]|uniref:Lactose phosphotransferase system repressor n=1 Tax=Compostimonas suwonensis TaxID=1048394 RepID=A0A2M9C3T7_9MICO|nr:DeoR/GlpR family DNA-binding transcription regulator [Compostimonas suwonensis]PJJ65149.1 DeoR/GlpR family transcriptional regulator of sugar metabolism [Compostimonas suwonensis]
MIASSVDAETRRTQLHALLERDGSLILTDAAEAYGVSEMTIRRDLFEMEQAGLARRVRGGAVAVGPQLFQRRQQKEAEAKRIMALKMLPLLPKTGAIAMDASSTVHRLAVEMPAADLTVLVSGVEAFSVLSTKAEIRAILSGGELERTTGALVGPVAQRTIRDFVFTRAFISPTCIDAELGATESTADGAEVKRTMRLATRSLVVAADSTKLNEAATARSLELADIDILVTELDPADPALDAFRGHVELL